VVVEAASLSKLLAAQVARELVLFFLRRMDPFVSLERAQRLEVLLAKPALMGAIGLMYVSHVGPDVCVGKIFEALVAFPDQAGFIKMLSHVVPHLLEVIGGEVARRLLVAFVLNLHLGVVAPPVFNQGLMVLAIFTAVAAASECRCLKHSHPLLLWGECLFPL